MTSSTIAGGASALSLPQHGRAAMAGTGGGALDVFACARARTGLRAGRSVRPALVAPQLTSCSIQLTTSVRSRSATAATGAVVILLTREFLDSGTTILTHDAEIATCLASLILAAITISRRRIHLLALETLVGTTTPDFEPVQYASSPLLYSPNRHLRRRSSSAALSEKLLPETLKETTKILKTRPVDSTLAILVEQLGEDGWWNMVVIGALFLLNDALT